MGLFDKAKRGLGYNDKSLKDTGIKGTAKVLSDNATHMSVGGDDDGYGGTPIHKETLLVTIAGREPYEVTYHLQGALPVGKELDVYVDQKDPKKVFLDTGTGLEGVAQRMSALTGQSVGSDPADIMQATQNMAAQWSAAAPGAAGAPGAVPGGTADWQQMAAQNAKLALGLVQDPAQRKMMIEQYRAAGIHIDDEPPSGAAG